MPYLLIQTNCTVDQAGREKLLATASKMVAEQLGKPESYVMVTIDSDRTMCFAGSTDPLAYLELKSLGLPENTTPDLSRALCELLGAELDISPDRIYIEFASPERHMFGWNSATFG